jgi:hypothetical protein
MREDIMGTVDSVLSGKCRSYVFAAQALAEYLKDQTRV